MTVDTGLIVLLLLGALVLAGLAVVLDRVNFPQKPFRPQRIRTGPHGATRDRTGAHILDEIDAEGDEGETGRATSDGADGVARR